MKHFMLSEYLMTVVCHDVRKMAHVVNMFTKYISCSCRARTIIPDRMTKRGEVYLACDSEDLQSLTAEKMWLSS